MGGPAFIKYRTYGLIEVPGDRWFGVSLIRRQRYLNNIFCKIVNLGRHISSIGRAYNTFWVVGSSPACVSKEEFLPIII